LTSFKGEADILDETAVIQMSGAAQTGNRSKGFVRNLYRSVTTSLDDILLAPSVLDVLSERVNKQASGMAGDIGSGLMGLGAMGLDFGNSYLGSTSIGASLLANQGEVRSLFKGDMRPSMLRIDAALAGMPSLLSPLEGETGASAFTAPLCDMFIELFDLKDSNWLRKQTIVILMQQLLGGTIER
jgi:sorting nexin-25